MVTSQKTSTCMYIVICGGTKGKYEAPSTEIFSWQVALYMAQLCTWLGKHTGRRLCRTQQSTGSVGSMDDIRWWLCTRWWIHRNKNTETSRDLWHWFSNNITTQWMTQVTVRHFKICISRSRTKFHINALIALSYRTIPIPMCHPPPLWTPSECHVLGDAQTSYSYTQPWLTATQFWCLWITNHRSQRLCILMAMCKSLR